MAAETLPGIMGLGLSRPKAAPKKSAFQFAIAADGTVSALDKPAGGRVADSVRLGLAESIASRREGTIRAEAAAGAGVGGGEEFVPHYMHMMGQLLHFRAFFTEGVVESPKETYRVRQLIIRYHLEDDTFEMFEIHQRNDGMRFDADRARSDTKVTYKRFLNRIQHPAVSIESLRIGEDITVYGRTIRIFACDECTRTWYENNDAPQLDDREMPTDAFMRERGEEEARLADPRIKMNPMKRHAASTLGVPIPKGDTLARFLENDGLVFTFEGYWDEPAVHVFGQKQIFTIRFHAVSDEVEVFRQRVVGNKQAPAFMLLKKRRLPRSVIVHDDRKSSCEDGDGAEDYYTIDDFIVGETINIYGRAVQLMSCDEATQRWFLREKGIDQNANKFEVPEPVVERPKAPTPPPTGFGADDDGFAFRRRRVHRVPRGHRQSGMTLKFYATLANEECVDEGRRFRITWYLDDDTIAVYEPPQRNSGHVGGSWQSRAKLSNPATGRSFEASEFFVGARVQIKGHVFLIEEADEFSLRHMENKTDLWPMSSIEFVMQNLKRKLQEGSRQLRKMFRKFDEDKSQTISITEFESMLHYYGMDISRAEAITIFRAFDRENTGFLSYEAFMQAFSDREDVGGTHATGRVDIEITARDDDEEYARMAEEAARKEAEDTYVEQLLFRIARTIVMQRKETAIHEKFRTVDFNKDHMIDRDEFFAAFGDCGLHLPEKDIRYLEKRFYRDGAEAINYDEFMRVIYEYADKVMRT